MKRPSTLVRSESKPSKPSSRPASGSRSKRAEGGYRSEALRSVHDAMRGLHRVGAVDKATMRRFDLACLTPVEPLAPQDIRAIREEAQMSQAIFALALNVTTSLVSQWERGEKRPSGPSLKLLALAKAKGVDAIL